MKSRIVAPVSTAILLLIACRGGVSPVTTVPEDGVAVPTGNAINPQLVTEATLDRISDDGTELRFKLWMGVEPCDVIDRVEVSETARSVDVEISRGVGDPNAVCVAMAVEKTVVVSLDAPLGDRTLTLAGDPVEA